MGITAGPLPDPPTLSESDTVGPAGPAPRTPPARCGPFPIDGELGRGGMGTVYLGRDPELGRPVAIKLLGAGASPEARARFEREGQAMARLRHPNLVTVHELGRSADGRAYLVMDYVEGESLAQRLRRGPLDPERARELLRQVGEAVAYAHAQGVLHRDLKPANILIERAGGRARVTDFGLARLEDQAESLTRSGQTLGTPAYMPPEQVRGDKGQLGPWSDVYALGATLYSCLTARLPFEEAGHLLGAVLYQDPPRPGDHAEVPPAFDRVVQRCMAKAPQRRYSTAEAFLAALRGEGSRSTEQRRRQALFGALPIALASLAAGLFEIESRRELPPTRSRPPSPTASSSPALSPPRRAEALALRPVWEALRAGDLRLALAKLEPLAGRMTRHDALRDEAARLRAQVMELGLELCKDEQRVQRLEQALSLVSLLNPDLEPVPPGSTFADAVIARVTRMQHAARSSFQNPAILRLVQALARARLEPRQVPALRLLQMLQRRQVLSPSFSRDYHATVLAMVRLQIDLQAEHVGYVAWYESAAAPRPTGTVTRYVDLLIERAAIQGGARPGRSLTWWRGRLFEFLVEEGDRLGPRTRAYALRECAGPSVLGPRSLLHQLREAVAVAPENPLIQIDLSEALHRHASDLLWKQSSPERLEIEALLREATAHAEQARRLALAEGWHEFPFGSAANRRAACSLAYLYVSLGEDERVVPLQEAVPGLEEFIAGGREWRKRLLELETLGDE